MHEKRIKTLPSYFYQWGLLYQTVKYLRVKQIFYRLFYLARKQLRRWLRHTYPLSKLSQTTELSLQASIPSANTYVNHRFTFLNLCYVPEESINWNTAAFGKLWTYNLNYFEFLNQHTVSKDEGLSLINDYIDQIENITDGLEAFPLSLRGMNWIKFLTRHTTKNQAIDDCLYAQYQILLDNLEYHLLGNHLLENAFSLLFAAYYFQDEEFYTQASIILAEELKEQILEDGAHFELSPMYHQLMLFRVLDCINLLQNNHWKNETLLSLLSKKAYLMLGWLNTISFKNGIIPLLNDAANHIAPTTQQLNDYASHLNIKRATNVLLNACGYRKIQQDRYECIIDVGNIGPDYIPGHAHSDTFNFELYIDGRPLIVDTGTSTYMTNDTRQIERSTAAHNTVKIDGIEQSEIWGSFRVARRAKIISLDEHQNTITAVHDGYKKRIGALHQRQFIFNNRSIRIIDNILSTKQHDAVAYLHFHPDVKIKIIDDSVFVDSFQIKQNTPYQKFNIKNYDFSPEFNQQYSATVLEISFNQQLDIEILI